MLLAYIWIGFFTIAFLLETIRTFVPAKANALYYLKAIPAEIITLLQSSKRVVEFAPLNINLIR
jgi:TM2 domain-containing membrane protein YozV